MDVHDTFSPTSLVHAAVAVDADEGNLAECGADGRRRLDGGEGAADRCRIGVCVAVWIRVLGNRRAPQGLPECAGDAFTDHVAQGTKATDTGKASK